VKYGRYSFTCAFETDAALPPYKGSTIRGIFGHALKKVVCALKKQDCRNCLLAPKCIYPNIFEMSPAPEVSTGRKRIAAPPHPYVIEPPTEYKTNYRRNDTLNFILLVFGAINDYLPYFIYAFDQMGQMGIGKKIDGRRASFSLQQVTMEKAVIYSKADGRINMPLALPELSIELLQQPSILDNLQIEIKLETPLRLKYQNTLHAELPFHVLTRSMLRRASSLLALYGGGEPPLDYRGMVKRAEQVRIMNSDIKWFDWRRYSNRQEQAMLIGGMIGSVIYEGQLAEYIPLLRFCEQVHTGKQTAFGLGKFFVRQL